MDKIMPKGLISKGEVVLVSACLMGLNCRYDGKHNYHREICLSGDEYILIPICPETEGGLSTPRPLCEIQGSSGLDVLLDKAKIINKDNKDVTKYFIDGAYKTLEIAKLYEVNQVIFKARSPSCGCGMIYDGSFTGKLRPGDGITTALLKDNGINVYTEEYISDMIKKEKMA